jgi:hypothetical protein
MRLASLLPHKFRFFDHFQLGFQLGYGVHPRIRGTSDAGFKRCLYCWATEALPGEWGSDEEIVFVISLGVASGNDRIDIVERGLDSRGCGCCRTKLLLSDYVRLNPSR